MQINGTYQLNASPDIVWKMLMDPKVLEKVTPGIKKLEPLDEDSYNAISEVKNRSRKVAAFEGKLSVKDKVEEGKLRLGRRPKKQVG